MAVAKRQRREKPTKIEQRGRSREGPRTGGRTSGRTKLGRPKGENKTYKKRSQRALSLSPAPWESLDSRALMPRRWIFLLSSK